MARSVLFVLGMLACAFLQARVLSELGLDRLLNLPLLLLALFATPYQLPSRLAGATVAGLALDALLMRPFGVTSLALCIAVLAGSALRSDVEGWPRRFVAAGQQSPLGSQSRCCSSRSQESRRGAASASPSAGSQSTCRYC